MRNNKLLKSLSFFAIFLTFITTSCIAVFADSANFDSALTSFLGHTASEEDKHNWSLAITSLQADGFSNAAIAGIMGNAYVEGAASGIYAIEGYSGIKSDEGVTYKDFESGKTYNYSTKPKLFTSQKTGKTMAGEGHGICQWSFDRAKNLSNFAKSHSEYGGITATHWVKDYDTDWFTGTYSIPNMGGQICFMLEEMHGDRSSAKDAIKDLTDAREAAKIFHDKYENSAGWSEGRASSAALAVPVVEACTGLVGSTTAGSSGSTGSGSEAANIANYMQEQGYWSEDELGAYCKLCELNIQEFLDGATRDRLHQDDLESLVNWERNVNNNKMEDGYIAKLRVATSFLGVMFIIWVMFVYLAYWLDRINTIFNLDFLGLVTFGKLHISDTEDKCTFRLSELGKTDKKTVNHKAVISICMVGVLFGTLIITGAFYRIIAAFVNLVIRVIKSF